MNRPDWTTRPGAVEALLAALKTIHECPDDYPVGQWILNRAAKLAAQAATQGAGGEGLGRGGVTDAMVNRADSIISDWWPTETRETADHPNDVGRGQAIRSIPTDVVRTALEAAIVPTGQDALLAAITDAADAGGWLTGGTREEFIEDIRERLASVSTPPVETP